MTRHMELKYAIHPEDIKSYDTQRIRKEFHSTGIMHNGPIHLVYTHYDRFIYGGIVPLNEPVALGSYDELKSEFFLQRREMGILNIGGLGMVQVDGEEYPMQHLDMLYVGRGKKELKFTSDDHGAPAQYYINSAPAHAEYPIVKMGLSEANLVELGDQKFANRRNLYQYIHEDGIRSCQLVMGFTELLEGNVWNTFPPHTHERRMEVYFYFDLPEDQIVVHFMGQPQETRHIAVHNHDAVLSPPWSIHAGAGTSAYKFVWGMAGENKAFSDMDGVPVLDFK